MRFLSPSIAHGVLDTSGHTIIDISVDTENIYVHFMRTAHRISNTAVFRKTRRVTYLPVQSEPLCPFTAGGPTSASSLHSENSDTFVGIICPGSDASALGTCALPRTGIFRIGKLQLAYDSIKVVRNNKNRGVESDRFPQRATSLLSVLSLYELDRSLQHGTP